MMFLYDLYNKFIPFRNSIQIFSSSEVFILRLSADITYRSPMLHVHMSQYLSILGVENYVRCKMSLFAIFVCYYYLVFLALFPAHTKKKPWVSEFQGCKN